MSCLNQFEVCANDLSLRKFRAVQLTLNYPTFENPAKLTGTGGTGALTGIIIIVLEREANLLPIVRRESPINEISPLCIAFCQLRLY
ncbi:hypothetical protein V6N12_040752 [Hibiscus sabdariffa]|uniref:Uncharacterized protein n=1 Tax=Hibiscus sabdariffa TaxID=183260 RepID=A0ABR2E4L4_9ROSI